MKRVYNPVVRPRLFLAAAVLACSACTAFVAHKMPASSSGASGATLTSLSAETNRVPLVTEMPIVLLMQKGASGLETKGIGLSLTAAGRIVTTASFDAGRSLFIARIIEQKPGYSCDSLVQVVSQDVRRGITLLQTIAPVAADCSQGSFVGEWQPLPVATFSTMVADSGSSLHVIGFMGGEARMTDGVLTGSGDTLQMSAAVSSLPSGGIVLDAAYEPFGLTRARSGSGSRLIVPIVSLSSLSELSGYPLAHSSSPAVQ